VITAAELVPWYRIPKRTVGSSFEDMSSLEQRITATGLIAVSRKYTDTGVTIVVEGPQDTVESIIARAAAGR